MTMALTPFPCDSSQEHTHLSMSLSDVVTLPEILNRVMLMSYMNVPYVDKMYLHS